MWRTDVQRRPGLLDSEIVLNPGLADRLAGIEIRRTLFGYHVVATTLAGPLAAGEERIASILAAADFDAIEYVSEIRRV